MNPETPNNCVANRDGTKIEDLANKDMTARRRIIDRSLWLWNIEIGETENNVIVKTVMVMN